MKPSRNSYIKIITFFLLLVMPLVIYLLLSLIFPKERANIRPTVTGLNKTENINLSPAYNDSLRAVIPYHLSIIKGFAAGPADLKDTVFLTAFITGLNEKDLTLFIEQIGDITATFSYEPFRILLHFPKQLAKVILAKFQSTLNKSTFDRLLIVSAEDSKLDSIARMNYHIDQPSSPANLLLLIDERQNISKVYNWKDSVDIDKIKTDIGYLILIARKRVNYE